MSSLPLPPLCFLIGSSLLLGAGARAQIGVSPEAAPARDEAARDAPTFAAPSPALVPVLAPAVPALPSDGAAPASSQLSATRVAYEGGTIVATGDAKNPVLFQGGLGQLRALEVRIDTLAKTVSATGDVQLQRETLATRRELRQRGLPTLTRRERFTETVFGQNLKFDYKTQTGSLDNGALQTAQVDFRADELLINGQKYSARNALVRPGGLSPEELRIYGTPPLNLRAREITVRRDAGSRRLSIRARGAGLFFKNTRLLPLPSAFLRFGRGGDQSAFRITPRVGFNSADGLLLAGRFGFDLARDPRQLALTADIGVSQRVGFRGGLTLDSSQPFGDLRLAAKRLDIVQTQLTNKIELDRKPELTFQSPAFGTFGIPGAGRAGFSLDAGYGRFTERVRGDDVRGDGVRGPVSSDRAQARLVFSTRLAPQPGPFLRAFAATSRYSLDKSHYDTTGVEFGYGGQLLKRINGEVSLRLTNQSGQTPFRFDLVEIPRELRTTFDVAITPRYLLPFDLRYDLDQSKVRDATFGILRSYKVFAYGVVYQTARKDLRLEVRSGF